MSGSSITGNAPGFQSGDGRFKPPLPLHFFVETLSVRLYELDPCKDARWPRFLLCHPDASVFHTPGWLEALQRTYDYEPVVYTTAPPCRELINGQVFCRVNSWLTGRRLVSVPFSDHAALLMSEADDLESLLSHLRERVDKESCKYVEIRPVDAEQLIRCFRRAESSIGIGSCWTRRSARFFMGFTRAACREKSGRQFVSGSNTRKADRTD